MAKPKAPRKRSTSARSSQAAPLPRASERSVSRTVREVGDASPSRVTSRYVARALIGDEDLTKEVGGTITWRQLATLVGAATVEIAEDVDIERLLRLARGAQKDVAKLATVDPLTAHIGSAQAICQLLARWWPNGHGRAAAFASTFARALSDLALLPPTEDRRHVAPRTRRRPASPFACWHVRLRSFHE